MKLRCLCHAGKVCAYCMMRAGLLDVKKPKAVKS